MDKLQFEIVDILGTKHATIFRVASIGAGHKLN